MAFIVKTATKPDGGKVMVSSVSAGPCASNVASAADETVQFATRIEAAGSNEGSPRDADSHVRAEMPTSGTATKKNQKEMPLKRSSRMC